MPLSLRSATLLLRTTPHTPCTGWPYTLWQTDKTYNKSLPDPICLFLLQQASHRRRPTTWHARSPHPGSPGRGPATHQCWRHRVPDLCPSPLPPSISNTVTPLLLGTSLVPSGSWGKGGLTLPIHSDGGETVGSK